MVNYKTSIDGIASDMLVGFFEGWPNPPTPETHLKILQNSDKVVIALDEDRVIGFITAITDKVLTSYIPLLEVLSEYRNQGVGQELVKRMIEELKDFYMIDLSCDENLEQYYEKFGMKRAVAMFIRNYDKQSGS